MSLLPQPRIAALLAVAALSGSYAFHVPAPASRFASKTQLGRVVHQAVTKSRGAATLPKREQPSLSQASVAAPSKEAAQPSRPSWSHRRWWANAPVLYAGFAAIVTGAAYGVATVAGVKVAAMAVTSMLLPMGLTMGQFVLGGGTKVVQRMGGFEACESSWSSERRLETIVAEVAKEAGVEAPRAFIIPTPELNAFAAGFGSRDSVVAVTTGLRARLNERELRAVIAHEVGHLRHRDVRRNMHVAAMIAGLYGAVRFGRILMNTKSSHSGGGGGKKKSSKDEGSAAALGVILWSGGLLTYMLGSLLQAAVSRHDEFAADAFSASHVGAGAMESALRKISDGPARGADSPLEANGMMAHMYFSDNKGVKQAKPGFFHRALSLWSTHPPLDERIDHIHGRD